MMKLPLSAACCVVFGSLGYAQEAARPDLARVLAEWREAHGANWHLAADHGTGHVEMLYGGRLAPAFTPRSDADFVDLARNALAASAALHGVELATLELVATSFLPLGQIGSGDKTSVRFRQVERGVPVDGACVNLLFAADGALLSLHSTALPEASSTPTSPALTPARATARAEQLFTAEHGFAPNRLSAPELVIAQVRGENARTARLVWRVDAQWVVEDTEPAGTTYSIDARDGSLVARETSIHHFDVGATVQSMASPGTLPDTSGNPESAQVMKHMRVTSAQGTVTTDANGQFTFPGVDTPLAVTVSFVGTYNGVTSNGAAPYSLTTTLQPNQAGTILMNPASTSTVTSQANAFRGVNALRDWVRSVNPTDAHADFVAAADVNLNSTCNAFYDGFAIRFFAAGGGCVNTAYSTIVSHEHGHWMNTRYQTNNGGDGMGEGNADVWAMYVWDTPFVGQGFGGGGSLRSGNNTRAFCGDANPGCYGEVHVDGEPWMGAAWKIRNRLNTAFGNAPGDLIANHLFLGWMNAYNQTQIRSIIETQWLTLDDDDGNLGNGTPHFAQIDGGFRDQGFPGVSIPSLAITNVTLLPDTHDENGPYVVQATITANTNPPVAGAVLEYRVGGGALQSVAMTSQGGGVWQAAIPGELSPAHVEYFVAATDNAAQTARFPVSAPNDFLDFDVGSVHVLRSDPFEANNDLGWTHGETAGTDDWQRGSPAGKSGSSGGIGWIDPASGYGFGKCWGTDLGATGFNGAYAASSNSWLRSPTIDASDAVGTKLRFKRWLSVQGSASDQARIRVNGIEVWQNPATNLAETGWSAHEIDIASIADGNASVQIEWSLQSNGTTSLGGWQIDNVEVLWVGPAVPPCPAPSAYCVASPNSFSATGATLVTQGTNNVQNDDLVLVAIGVPPGKTGLFFYGQNETSVPFGNGVRCVAAPFFRLAPSQANFVGDLFSPLELDSLPSGGPISSGEVWKFQLWYRDPDAGGAAYTTSNALSIPFCP